MKSIFVTNELEKKLVELKKNQKLESEAEVIKTLVNSYYRQSQQDIELAPDILEALIDLKKIAHLKDMNQVIVNLLFNFSEETYKNLVEKYFK